MRAKLLRWFGYAWTRLSLPLVGLGLWWLTEALARGSLTYALDWARHNGWLFVVNAGIVLAVCLIVVALAGRIRLGFWLCAALLVPIALANALKLQGFGFPLFPWDVLLGTEEFTWAGLLPFMTGKMALLAGGFLLAAGLALHLVPWYRGKLAYVERVVLAALAVTIWGSVYNDRPFPLQHKAAVATTPWDPIDSYRQNGFLLSTMLNMPLTRVERPAGYGKDAIESLLAGASGGGGAVGGGAQAGGQAGGGGAWAGGQAGGGRAWAGGGGDAAASGRANSGSSAASGNGGAGAVKPNVIVILSEAFWDPTIVPGVTFSEDPLPTLHSLLKRYPGGWLQTPEFGGGTANVEFEVLSSQSMRFLPKGSLPYVQYVNRGLDSLASILTRQGYAATAVNPLDSWFFNSRKVYKNMGFQRFVSSEFFEPVYEGMFLSDDEVAQTIFRETERTAGPDMVFANTMENHYPFYPGKFKMNTIRVDGSFPAGTKGIMETYAQGIHAADRMLKTLVDHYSALKEPTIIVFFGDHLPALDSEEKVYKNIGWIKGNADEDPDYWWKMYRTPFVVWDNFLPPGAGALPEAAGLAAGAGAAGSAPGAAAGPAEPGQLLMSPSFLAPYALQRVGLPGTAFTDYVGTLARSVPVIPPQQHYADLGVREEQLAGYRLLEYDALFGRRYAYAAERLGGKVGPPPRFRLGDSKPVVVSAAAEPAAGGAAAADRGALTVRGSGFAPQAAVFADGRALPTERVDAATLRAALPGSRKPRQRLAVQVKLLDSKGFTLQTSNTVVVNAP